MSIYKLDNNLAISDKIEDLNDMIIEVNGKIDQGKFDINEINSIYTDLSIDRKFLRDQILGNTLTTYTGWTHIKAETGYSIWKFTPTTYTYNSVNKLYFDDKVLVNKGQADAETATSFTKVFLYNGDSGSGFTDNSAEAATETGTEFDLMDSTEDFLYLGLSTTFGGIKFEFQTRGSNYTLKVEYYSETSGLSWEELTANDDTLADNTSGLVSDGTITWNIPDDWGLFTVNSQELYWIRISTTTTPVTTAKAYYIIPGNSVVSLLALSSDEILDETWKWCYFNSGVYVTIRNNGGASYEGSYYITSSSSATNLKNFFIYNHEYKADYQDSAYSNTGIALTTNLNANLYRIINLTDPVNSRDAATKSYVDSQISLEEIWDRSSSGLVYLNTLTDKVGIGVNNPTVALEVSGNSIISGTLTVGGLSLTSNLNMGINKIINLADPTNSRDAATKSYVDSKINLEDIWDRNSSGNIYLNNPNDNVGIGTETPQSKLDVNGILNLNRFRITNVGDPINLSDATTKSYVDTKVVIENLWDRASGSTTLTPYYANDNINLGSGNVQTTGNLTDGSNSLTIANAKDAYNKRIDNYTLPLTFSNNILTLNYDTSDFGLSGNNFFIRDIGIDHGAIGGLLDDDHTQYLTNARASIWLANQSIDSLSDITIGSGIASGHVLMWNGSRWTNSASSASPGGSNTQVQFNDGGSFGGDAGLTYNKTTDVLTIVGGLDLSEADIINVGNIYLDSLTPDALSITINENGNNPVLIIDNDGTSHGLQILQDGVLASGKYGLYLYSNAAQTNVSAMLSIINDNASSNANCNPLYIQNDSTTADSIYEDSGALLTVGGVWTNAPSTYSEKENIALLPLSTEYIQKLKNLNLYSYQKKREVYGAKEDILSTTGEDLTPDEKKDGDLIEANGKRFRIKGNKKFEITGRKYSDVKKNPNARVYKGYILDDSSTPEELISRDFEGNINGVSPADGVNFLLAVNKELLAKIEQLEQRILNLGG